jgi:hypothetical protein
MLAAMPASRVIRTAPSSVQFAAPLIAAAVTWGAPRVLGAAYQAGTGRRAPSITSTRYSLLAKVAWAMAVAGLVAVTQAVIFQTIEDTEVEPPTPMDIVPPESPNP